MTKEEKKEYKRKYYQEHKEEMKEYNKKYYQNHKEKYSKTREKQSEYCKKIYKIDRTAIHIPQKYRQLFDEFVDIVILKNGVYIYKHNGKNKGNNIIVRNITNNHNGVLFGEKEMYKRYGYVPSKITYKQYKNGLLGMFVND